MNRRSGFGWLELIVGILLIVLGVLTLVFPGSMLTGLIVIYGLIAVVMGILDIVEYVKLERYTGFGPTVSLISGIISVMCGVMLLVYPNAGKWVLSLLFPIWFITHCISRLAHLDVIRIMEGKFYFYFALVSNILGLILGILMILSPVLSFLTLQIIGYVVAFYLILLGIESIVAAFGQRKPQWRR